MRKPYWHQVLQHFEANNYIHNGLTLPFLIGARTIVEPENSILSIDKFLEEVNDYGISITIMKCGNIGEYVIGLLDAETERYLSKHPKAYDQIGNILCTDQSINGFSELSEIATMLKSEYQDIIADENYSKNNGEWGEFSKLDKLRLHEIYESS